MKPELFVFLSLVNKNLREGSVLNRIAFGVETKAWRALASLQPERMPDGSYRGDAAYFLNRTVQTSMQKFQSAVRYYSERTNCVPLPGEQLTEDYIPRLVVEITKVLQEKGVLSTDMVEITPDNLGMIACMDTYQMKELIVSTFDLADMPAELQNDLIGTIGELVIQAVMVRAVENMDETQLAEFEQLTENGDNPESVLAFVESCLPEFDSVVAEEVMRIRSEMTDTPSDSSDQIAE